MSQVARVFVVLNLLVAVGFLFAAATFLAANKDYKDQLTREKDARKTEVGQLNAKIDELQKQYEKLDRDYNSTKESRATLETANGALTKTNEQLRGDLQQRDSQIQGFTDQLGKLQEAVNLQARHVQNLEQQNEAAQTQAREARASEQKALASLEAEQGTTRDLRNDVAEKERSITALTNDTNHKQLMIDLARGRGINFENLLIMKPVRGQVVGADAQTGLVMINAGREAGVERGYVMDVVRGERYIGRFRIDNVDSAIATGVMTLTTQGESVRTGDFVTNTLN